MKKFNFIIFILLLLNIMIYQSCSSPKTATETGRSLISSPPAIVYKTREDYFDKVPVTLSEDRQQIISFPAQSDLLVDGKFSYPTLLLDGYLLDNRGINQKTAFLRFSYEDYYNMDNIPNAQRLINYIIDDQPFIEFYEVGRKSDFQDLESQINQMISNKKLQTFKNLVY